MDTSTESFLARLSADEIRVIVSTLNGESYQSIANAVGVSRPTLMERRRLLNQKLAEFLEGFDERDRIAAMDALYLAALPLVDER
jgi:DNA-directed RNA polymerase specialized sigma24 family protein